MANVKEMTRAGFDRSDAHHEHTHKMCAELKQIVSAIHPPSQMAPSECTVCVELKDSVTRLRVNLKRAEAQELQGQEKADRTRAKLNELLIENDNLVRLKAENNTLKRENSSLRASSTKQVTTNEHPSDGTKQIADGMSELIREMKKHTSDNQTLNKESLVRLEERDQANTRLQTRVETKTVELARATSQLDHCKQGWESTQTELDTLKSQLRIENSSKKGKLGEKIMLAYMQENNPHIQSEDVSHIPGAGDILCHINWTTPPIRLMLEVKNKKVPNKLDREKAHRDTLSQKNAYDSSLVVCYLGHNQESTDTMSNIDQRTFFVYGVGEEGGSTRFQQAFMVAIVAGIAYKNRTLVDTNPVADITLPILKLFVDDRVVYNDLLGKLHILLKEEADGFKKTSSRMADSFDAMKSVVFGSASHKAYDYCAGLIHNLNDTKPTNDKNNTNKKRKRGKNPITPTRGLDQYVIKRQ
jgi:hypothetical protein